MFLFPLLLSRDISETLTRQNGASPKFVIYVQSKEFSYLRQSGKGLTFLLGEGALPYCQSKGELGRSSALLLILLNNLKALTADGISVLSK